MIAEIKKSTALGKIAVPSSKSIAHRLLISAAMAEGISVIKSVTPSQDVIATVKALTYLGAKIESDGNDYVVTGCNMKNSIPKGNLFCHESASTLRFIIPIAALSGNSFTINLGSRLSKRPIDIYEDIFSEKGMLLTKGEGIINGRGPLSPGEYVIKGNVSSQFITGLLFALPTLNGDSTIKIIPPFQSKPYVDLTIDTLKKFGITVYFEDDFSIKITGNQHYTSGEFAVEGDYSSAAFLDAFNLIGSNIEILGLLQNSLQADRAYIDFYSQIKNGAPKINLENCPDLAPILFALSAYLNGATFIGTSRLKIKESDRAAAMAQELGKFGANIQIFSDSVIIKSSSLYAPKEILCGHNDHRVVMALSVLLSVFGGSITNAESVFKSYPDFFEDIRRLGIKVTLHE